MEHIALADGTATAYLRGMSATTFDTYAAAKTLREAGFDERQAEATVAVMRDATAADRDTLATKADLANLETRLVRLVYTVAAGQAALVVGAVFALLKMLLPAGTP